jgi:hypothetical protein
MSWYKDERDAWWEIHRERVCSWTDYTYRDAKTVFKVVVSTRKRTVILKQYLEYMDKLQKQYTRAHKRTCGRARGVNQVEWIWGTDTYHGAVVRDPENIPLMKELEGLLGVYRVEIHMQQEWHWMRLRAKEWQERSLDLRKFSPSFTVNVRQKMTGD